MITRRIWIHFLKRTDNPFFLTGGIIGGGLGFSNGILYGFDMSHKYKHGAIWRPMSGALLGGLFGGVCGIYWIEALGLLFLYDVYQSTKYLTSKNEN